MFFIIGSARSGTTLLRMMLNAHPEVAVPPESRFVTDLYRTDEVVTEEFLERLAAHTRWPSWETPIADVRARIGGRARIPHTEAVEAAYETFARARGKSRFGDKTPRYIEELPLLARLWPRAKFVHLVRDGREVALSFGDVPFGPKTVARAARLWSDRVVQGIERGRPLGPDRYLEMHYEDLLDNPRQEMEALCRFLELDFDPAMLDYAHSSRVEALDRAKLYNPYVTRAITRTRSWREEMPAAQIEVFEAVAGDTLATMGYERIFPAPSLGAKLAGLLGRAHLPVGRLRATKAAVPS
ncbi:MAG: sulfotransferase family protein [Actinomycetota bacterium]